MYAQAFLEVSFLQVYRLKFLKHSYSLLFWLYRLLCPQIIYMIYKNLNNTGHFTLRINVKKYRANQKGEKKKKPIDLSCGKGGSNAADQSSIPVRIVRQMHFFFFFAVGLSLFDHSVSFAIIFSVFLGITLNSECQYLLYALLYWLLSSKCGYSYSTLLFVTQLSISNKFNYFFMSSLLIKSLLRSFSSTIFLSYKHFRACLVFY